MHYDYSQPSISSSKTFISSSFLNRSSFQAFYCSHSGLGPPVKSDVLQGEKSHESNRSVGLIGSNFSTLIRLEKRTNHRKVGAKIYMGILSEGGVFEVSTYIVELLTRV